MVSQLYKKYMSTDNNFKFMEMNELCFNGPFIRSVINNDHVILVHKDLFIGVRISDIYLHLYFKDFPTISARLSHTNKQQNDDILSFINRDLLKI